MRLVKDWKRAHTWLSVQLIGATAALEAAYMAMPESLRMQLPEWTTHALAILLLVSAVAGRLIDQSKGDDNGPNRKPSDQGS